MSFRSPTPDGLAVAPNAAGNVNNPAAQNVELQVHHYWGRYSLTTQLPNVGTVDGLAVVGVNPAAVPAYDKLAPGDLAFAQSTNRLYVCIDRGTVSGNNAVWESLNSAAVTQTVRDAHVIVVGETGHLAALAGVASPPLATNSLNLDGVTGDVVSVTCDYLDPGDGSQLRNALAAAAAGGVPIDIRLRPCSIVVSPAVIGVDTHAFTVPAGCRLIGAGSVNGGANLSTLTGTDGIGPTSQSVVRLGNAASLEDVSVVSPRPTAAPGGAGVLGVVDMAKSATVRRCYIQLEGSNSVNRVAVAACWCSTPTGGELIEDSVLFIESLALQPVPATSYGALIGDTASFVPMIADVIVRNCLVQGNGPTAVQFQNCEGGRCENVVHTEVLANSATIPVQSFVWAVTTAVGVTAGETYRGIKLVDCRTQVENTEIGDTTGALIAVVGAAFGPAFFGPFGIDGYQAEFDTAVNPGTVRKDAIRINIDSNDASEIRDVAISNSQSRGQRRGIVVDGSGVNNQGRIISVRVTNAQHRNSAFIAGPLSGYGAHIRGGGNTSVLNVGLVNCDFSGALNAGAICVYIENAQVSNTQVGFCNAVPGVGGVAITDNGTGSEIAHNIV